MNKNDFKAIIEKDEDGYYVASIPSVPGCHSQGSTFEEAIENIKEALDLCLDVANSDPEYKSKITFNRSSVFSIVDIQTSKDNA